ncbi:MAG: Nif3-like dinuclear metal center hexameric protein [Desulfovibrionales bacterium]
MDVRTFIRLIEQSAPPHFAAPWDTSGVQVAGTRKRIEKLAVLLDPLPGSLREPLAWGADFVLAHHPLALKPRLPDRVDDYHRVLSMLLEQGSWLYSAHTSLDANPAGPAGWLSRALGLESVRVLEPVSGEDGSLTRCEGGERQLSVSEYGFGLAGRLRTPFDWSGFAARLEHLLGTSEWKCAGKTPSRIETVAYCGGSGGTLIRAAARVGADVFVTGDVKYHQAHESYEHNTFVLDVGHFILEERMMSLWAGDLEDTLEEVAVRFFPGYDPIRQISP